MTALLRTDAMTWIPYDKGIEDQLRVVTKYSGEVSLSKRFGDCLLVPRGLYPVALEDHRSKGHPIAVNCTVPPRNITQAQVLDKVVEKLISGRSFITQAATGFGKTYIAISAMCQVGVTTLVVVTKEDLMVQWRKALLQYTDLTKDDIGLIQQENCSVEGKKVVLAMVHSLAKDKYGEYIKDYFGLVIFDEVHRMAAETFSISCGMFRGKLRLGLSATAERPDGKSFVFRAHIGKVEVVADLPLVTPKIMVQTTSYRLPKWMTGKYAPKPGKLMGVFKDMAQNDFRNQLIVQFVCAAYKKDRRTIVFSHLLDVHLKRLYFMFTQAGISAEDIGYYVGGMTEKQREVSSKKKVILATYKMTAEATDIPWLDTAVFATPQSNILQPMGRILREWEGKKEPVVFDLVDHFVGILVSYFHTRRAQYHKVKAKVVTL